MSFLKSAIFSHLKNSPLLTMKSLKKNFKPAYLNHKILVKIKIRFLLKRASLVFSKKLKKNQECLKLLKNEFSISRSLNMSSLKFAIVSLWKKKRNSRPLTTKSFKKFSNIFEFKSEKRKRTKSQFWWSRGKSLKKNKNSYNPWTIFFREASKN